jgi:LPPG:FO 2-phospho-L-lactate transferase
VNGPGGAEHHEGPVIVLAGGTGGAKLARGMLDVVSAEQLVVLANTGDDLEIYGAHVSPDPDLVTFWLADRIDERGWGLAGDTFAAMDALRELGVEVWFKLGDKDLAIGLERAERLASGARLTDVQAHIADAFGVRAKVLPMSDQPVRTQILAHDRWWTFQEFMIRARAEGPVNGVRFRGIDHARATPEALDSIAAASVVIVGPSNPEISIGPILATPGIREALNRTTAPVIAVSPLVQGEIVKGPTKPFMEWAGHPLTSDGIAAAYRDVIDGLVADERAQTVPTLMTDVLMKDAVARKRVAGETLEFALALRG